MRNININVKLIHHSKYKDSEYVHLWVHLLMSALPKDRDVNFRGEVFNLKRGEFISSIGVLSEETKIERNKVKRLLDVYKEDTMITAKTVESRVGAILAIVNYDEYQPKVEAVNPDHVLTSEELDEVIHSWKRISRHDFEYRGRYNVGVLSKHRDALEERATFKNIRSYLKSLDVFLTEDMLCEKITVKANMTKLEIQRAWSKLVSHDAAMAHYVREHIGKEFVNRVRDANAYNIGKIKDEFTEYWIELKGG